jgi:protein phosphatase
VAKNVTIGWMYFALTAVLLVVCAAAWPWSFFLVWPITYVGKVTAGYCGLGAGIYGKRAGRLPLTTQIVLGPVLFGQYLSLVYYRRQCRPWDEVAPGVWIGRRLNDAEAAEAIRQGVTAVLDLSVEFSEARPFCESQRVEYHHLPVLDLTAPTQAQLVEGAAFIDSRAKSGVVYVHCKIGYSRSAAMVCAWLLSSGRATSVEGAILQLRSVRPTIVVRPEVQEALRLFAVRSIEGATAGSSSSVF